MATKKNDSTKSEQDIAQDEQDKTVEKEVVKKKQPKASVKNVEAQEVEKPEYTEEEVSEMDKLRKAAEDSMNFALRTKADMENMKKRNQNIGADMFNEGKTDTLMKIIPVIDNFDRALAMDIPPEIKEGFEKIRKQFQDILDKLGVEEIKAEGEEFDPKLHNALMQVDNEEMSGKVVQVCEKGYKLNDKILRHSSVVVGK